MVPSTWLALLLFLFVVSPGVLFDLLESRRRVSAAESTFREIGRVVLGSLGFTVVAVLLLLIVRLPLPHQLPDPKALIKGGSGYFADHYVLVFVAISAEAVLAHGIAYALHLCLARRSGGDTIRQMSAWSKVFKADVPHEHAVYARLRLGDGAVFSGQVVHFTADLPLADREIVLTRPLASRTGTNPMTSLPAAYRYAVIRGSAIETMAVEHRPMANVDSTSTMDVPLASVPTPTSDTGIVSRIGSFATSAGITNRALRTVGFCCGTLVAAWSLARIGRRRNVDAVGTVRKT